MRDRPEAGRVVPNAPAGLPQRQRLFHTPPPWVSAGEVFFITICCARRRENHLATATVFPGLTNALEHYVRAGKLWAHLFLAMPDHLHALWSFSRQEEMTKVIRDWKRFIAKTAGIAWQDGFFDHWLRHDESFAEKAYYIRTNPVRAGLASASALWPYPCPASDDAAAR